MAQSLVSNCIGSYTRKSMHPVHWDATVSVSHMSFAVIEGNGVQDWGKDLKLFYRVCITNAFACLISFWILVVQKKKKN